MQKSQLRRGRFIGAVITAALIAAACSSSGDASQVAEEAGVATTSPAAETSTSTAETTTETTTVPAESVEAIPEVAFDFGVSEDTIRVGYSLDLSGEFSFHDARVLDGHFALFDAINEQGGIAGRSIEVVALDNAFDVPSHLDNVGQLLEPTADGVALIGGLSHPNFDDATVSAAAETGALIIGNSQPSEQPSGVTVVPLRSAVCVETVTGIAALQSITEADQPQVAIVTSSEPWAIESAATARLAAETLELDIVVDATATGDDDVAAAIEELLNSEPDLVWVAASPGLLASLASALDSDEETRDWLWSGPDLSVEPVIFDSAVGAALAEVYLHVTSDPLVDAVELGDARAALAESAPELTYTDAGPALFGWEQAEFIVDVLTAAAESGDLTRLEIAATAAAMTPDVAEPSVYAIDQDANPNVVITQPGSSGLTEVFQPSGVSDDLTGLCQ